MKKFYPPVLLMLVILLVACKKTTVGDPSTPVTPIPGGSTPGGGTAAGYFFENTEWTGVAKTYGQEYQQPLSLRFSGDTVVTAYALFAWVLDGVNRAFRDSSVGKITAIDTVTGGKITIQVTFTESKDQQTLIISDKKTLAGGSTTGSPAFYTNQYTQTLELCPKPIPSVEGTTWQTDRVVRLGGSLGGYAYPDINDFSFSSDGSRSTIYYRDGHIVTFSPSILAEQYVYYQFGTRVYFAGYNESTDVLIPYFGVLSADGKNIWADSRIHGRLPNYIQSDNSYGDAGTTPTTHKQ